ncbi:MAG: heme exporter protein CcmB [Acidimicrobiia bacterium]
MSTPFLRQAAGIAAKDLRSELRSGEVLFVTIPFGAVALLLIPLAVGTDLALLERIGPGLYWVVVLLFGLLVTQRQSAVDRPPQRDLLRLLGVDPAAGFAGRVAAGTVLLLAFEALVGTVMLVLYDPDLTGWPWLAAILPLTAWGLALLGTLTDSVTAGLSSRATLTPLLVAPLAIPLLLAATQALEGLRLGTGILSWVLLLVVMDLVLAITGVLAARPLEEAIG